MQTKLLYPCLRSSLTLDTGTQSNGSAPRYLPDNGWIRSLIASFWVGLFMSLTATTMAQTYNPNGTTVAGITGSAGTTLNKLDRPNGVFVALDGTVYVADSYNHRVQKWSPGATSGITVAGGNGAGNAPNQLNRPTKVFVGLGAVYVADADNYRVQKWAAGATSGITVAGGRGYGSAANQLTQPNGVYVNGSGTVYVTDYSNNRVQKWAAGALSGTTIASVSGPTEVFVDAAGAVYVAGGPGNRVQKWAPGATTGITVAGGNGAGAAANQLNFPQGLCVDGSGAVYVADTPNHRIQKWPPGATTGTTVAGGNGAGAAANQLNNPFSVSIDGTGSLYIADAYNQRIQKINSSCLSLLTQPVASMLVNSGTTVTAFVTTRGTVTGYQWYKGNTLLTGQNSPTLTLQNVTTANIGKYQVMIQGDCSNRVSNEFSLGVLQPATPLSATIKFSPPSLASTYYTTNLTTTVTGGKAPYTFVYTNSLGELMQAPNSVYNTSAYVATIPFLQTQPAPITSSAFATKLTSSPVNFSVKVTDAAQQAVVIPLSVPIPITAPSVAPTSPTPPSLPTPNPVVVGVGQPLTSVVEGAVVAFIPKDDLVLTTRATGKPSSGRLAATTDETSGRVTLSVSGLPPGLSFTPPSTIEGIPTEAGISIITVRATNEYGLSSCTSFYLTVSSESGAPGPPLTNTAPRVSKPVPFQRAATGVVQTLSLTDVFTDAETPNQLTLSASGLPAGLSFTAPGIISGTPSVPGISIIEVMATDPEGLLACTSFYLVTNTDDTKPAVLTRNITVPLDAVGKASITPALINDGSTDDYTPANALVITLDKTSFDCSNVGVNTVNLTVTDASGNSDSKTATVTIADQTAPIAKAKPITVQLNASGSATITAEEVNDGSSDACGLKPLSLSKTSFDCSNVGANTVTLTVTDNNGNVSTATATVTVEDKIVPVAKAKPITIQLNASGTAIIAAGDVNDGSSDACGLKPLSLSKTSFTCANIGANTVTLTVTDNNGNVSTATAAVMVEDKMAPVISCQAGPVNHCFAINNTYAVPTLVANDNCGIASINFAISGATNRSGSGNDASGQFQPGTSTVLWTVTDQSGNKSQCSTTVVVNAALSLTVPNVNPIGAGAQPNTIYTGYGPQSLTLQALPTGGTAPYRYRWTGGTTASSLVVTAAGVYIVTVTDAKGCELSFSLTIKVVDVRCGNKDDKVAVCQKTGSDKNPWNQICASENAVATYLANGSVLGQCGSASGGRLGVEEVAGLSITLLSNPIEASQVRASVLGAAGQPLTVVLIDMRGQIVRQQAWQQADTSQLIEWSLSAQPVGVYLLRAVSNGQQQTAKVVKPN